MTRYLLRRVGASVVMLALTSVAIFVVLRAIPGDPTMLKAGRPGVTAEQIAAERARLGLDRPILEQYFDWVGGLLTGDLGRTYFSDTATTALIGPRIFPTIELTVVAVLLALAVAVPLALVASARPGSLLDRLFTGGASAGMSIPVFWLGVMLIALFAVELHWLPSRGYVSPTKDLGGNLRHLILPAVSLGLVLSAPIYRFLRSALAETLRSDYVRTARGKGISGRELLVRHALPNALLPTLTFVGLIVGYSLGGVVLVEWVFGWPGLGSLAIDSVFKRDYIVLQTVVMLAATTFILVTLLTDIATFVIDPRMRGAAGGPA